MLNQIQLLNDTQIRIDHVTLSPWPCFKIQGCHDKLPSLLVDLLLSEDTVPLLWSAKIGDELRQLLLSFPESIMPELLTLSQIWPDKFIDWSKWCPALIALLIQNKAPDGKFWDEFDQLRLMKDGWKEILKRAGWSPTRSNLRLLQKLPINYCTPQNLMALRAHIKDRRKLKLLRHCRHITSMTLDTLKLPASVLSVRLLEFTENDLLPLEVDTVVDLCEELIHFRQDLGLEPLWPYRHGRFSARTLHNAVQLQYMLSCCQKQSVSMNIPPPPLPSIRSSQFDVEPLTTLSALYRESNQQQNCIVSFGAHILRRTHYAYRMNRPERATILLLRNGDDWYPNQIKTYRNGDPKSETIEMVERWLGSKIRKEPGDDAPF
jgi:hypothetical protein